MHHAQLKKKQISTNSHDYRKIHDSSVKSWQGATCGDYRCLKKFALTLEHLLHTK